MKAVSLILALAVITGCNARVVRQADATPDRWEETVDRFWQYISELNQKADGVVENLKASQISRELDTLITDTMAELTTYKDSIQTNLAPYTQTDQLSQDLQLLANRLQKDMVDAKERSTEYLGELRTMVDLNADDARVRLTTYTNKLKKRLNKDTEEIRNTVATYLGEVQSRASQNLQTVRGYVEPHVQQASDSATKRLSDISTLLKTQAEGLGQQFEAQAETLKTQAEGIKTQLEATAQELRTSLEGKIDELTELLAPYAKNIREQVENVMDKVKETTTA